MPFLSLNSIQQHATRIRLLGVRLSTTHAEFFGGYANQLVVFHHHNGGIRSQRLFPRHVRRAPHGRQRRGHWPLRFHSRKSPQSGLWS